MASGSYGQFTSRNAFHKSSSVHIVSDLEGRWIDYLQKIGNLLSEPESPPNIEHFGYPVAVA